MGRELGLGRGERGEEELGRARAAPDQSIAEANALGGESLPRDLVDGARVEVVNECVSVTVESVCTHRRESGRDGVEGVLD